MHQRKQALNVQLNQVIDALLLVALLWLCHAARYYGAIWFEWIPVRIAPFREFTWMLVLLIPFGPLLLEMQGFYEFEAGKGFWRSLGQAARAMLGLLLLLGTCTIFLRLDVPSRSVLGLFALIAPFMLVARERLYLRRLRARARRGALREPVLLAGTPADMAALEGSLSAEEWLEMEIVGRIDIEQQSLGDLVEALHRHAVGRVVFAGSGAHLSRVQEAIAACETEGVEAWLLADFVRTSIARPDLGRLGSHPVLVFRSAPALSWQMVFKGALDRAGALLMLLLAAPLMLAAALMIRVTSPGPVLFRQMRAGLHGRPFRMYKFRTMQNDAEMRRAELEAYNQMSGPVFKLADDPRITSFGRWLRRTSIDELPQLWNVLRGDMSLVGPRPLPLYEVEKFEERAQRRRLSVKPGLTCLWQIRGRNRITAFDDWVRLDLEYIDNWSIWLDLRILLRTIPVVLMGFGAR
jgi:exopolysaccharide biosynthesis polyprenyl glycosylphosphotransferase